MNIAFATLFDLDDVTRGSGTFYHMSRELMRQGHLVRKVGPIEFEYPTVSRAVSFLHKKVGKRYVAFLDPYVGVRTGREVSRRLASLDFDVLMTNDLSIAANVRTGKPVVIYTDAMITRDYRERHLPFCRLSGLSPLSLALSRMTIRRALRRANLCVFPAQWAHEEALGYYRDPSKMAVIPFGPNLEDPGAEVAAARRFEKVCDKGKFELLFVGKDWARKGGDVAVKTVAELRRRGVNAVLHVVGATPPYPVDQGNILVHGLLDKSNPRDRRSLHDLYRTCDAFILPSSSEGYVIVALEAAAYGLPALAYDTIGVNTAISHGKTGLLFGLGQSEQVFADGVQSWFDEPSRYDSLVAGSRRHFEQTANWGVAVSHLVNIIENKLL